MVDLTKVPYATQAAILLTYYGFDLNSYDPETLVLGWLEVYDPAWVRSAIIEALYQGRYKAISVEQILVLWARRGQPLRHFNREFERIVCNELSHEEEPLGRTGLPGEMPPEPSPFASKRAILEDQGIPLNVLDAAAANSILSESESNPFAEIQQPCPPSDGSQSVQLARQFQLTHIPKGRRVSGEAIPPFEPEEDNTLLRSPLERSSDPVPAMGSDAIHQFVPNPQSSEFHTKLKAVAQSEEMRSP